MEAFIDEMYDETFLIILMRLFIALILSGIIGLEREWKKHSAGFRTHILVGVGSSLMMLLSLYGFQEFIETYDQVRFDPARIPSYVISGIGFLGAGTIIVYGGTIRGLTTAASIWAVAGIGLVVGAGMYGAAIAVTLIILFSLVTLNNMEKIFPAKKRNLTVEIISNDHLKVHDLLEVIEKKEMVINRVQIEKAQRNLRKIYVSIDNKNQKDIIILFDAILRLEDVHHVERMAK